MTEKLKISSLTAFVILYFMMRHNRSATAAPTFSIFIQPTLQATTIVTRIATTVSMQLKVNHTTHTTHATHAHITIITWRSIPTSLDVLVTILDLLNLAFSMGGGEGNRFNQVPPSLRHPKFDIENLIRLTFVSIKPIQFNHALEPTSFSVFLIFSLFLSLHFLNDFYWLLLSWSADRKAPLK